MQSVQARDLARLDAILEELSKELATPIIISADTLGAAGVRAKIPLREVQLRGRHALLRIALLDGARLKQLLG